jgi:preprotein translocase subunit SecB
MTIKTVRLKQYFFSNIKVDANPSFIPPEEREVGININKEIRVSVNEENDSLYQVQLDIKIAPQEGKTIPYNVELKAIGFLEVEGDSPDKEGIVRAHGASVLYSATREFLLGIMCRGPWPPIMLPLTIFSTHEKKTSK